MPPFTIKRNDRLPAFRAQLFSDAGITPVDLTTATGVRLKTGPPLNLNGVCNIVNAPQGIVEYAWAEVDTANSGVLEAEVEVTWPGALQQTFPSEGHQLIQIEDDLG